MAASLKSLILALDCNDDVRIRPGRRAAMQSHASRVLRRQAAARRSKQIAATSRAAASSAMIRPATSMSTLSISKNKNAIAAAAALRGRRKLARRSANDDGLEKRIRMLRRLIPDCEDSGDLGVDGLFREAVDYISCLEMKVRVMKIMVSVLSSIE